MRSIFVGVCIAVAAIAVFWVESSPAAATTPAAAIDKGARWLASVQGADGGWGQDSGLSNGNDVANTAMAALALLRAGKQYDSNVERALAFLLKRVEASPADGLAITNVQERRFR